MRGEVALTLALWLLVVCGAIVIPEARRRAGLLAAILALVGVSLGLLVGLAALIGQVSKLG